MSEEFQLVAGHVALDFANTVDYRYDPAKLVELLTTYERFVAFSRQAGLLSVSESRKLLAETEPAAANRALVRIIELREALLFLFSAVVAGEAPPRSTVERLNGELGRARSAQELVWDQGRFAWRSEALTHTPLAPLGGIALAAAELLTSADLVHVRECSASTCRWLFLDRSKNHSRRWCDMKMCGNRAKAQRFHARQD